jgi:glycolate oxidase iron-sulfur subunit
MLTEAETSARLLDGKMAEIAATGATTVVTANPGCLMQLDKGLRQAGLRGEVKHVVELLDESYAG